jgi:hypothetical protein
MKIWNALTILLAQYLIAAEAISQVIPFNSFVNSQYVSKLSNNTLKIAYVPSSTGTPVITSSFALPKAYHKEVTLEYDILFDKNFEWVKGGKLPGLLSENRRATGCIQPQPTDGWSYRLMWRSDAKISLYIYDQLRCNGLIPCGSSIESRPGILSKDKWINFKMYMKVNSHPNKSDGIAKLYVNNVSLLSRSGIKFSSAPNASIYYATFTTFYGGHDPSWGPTKTTYAYIRGATIYNSEPS